MKVQCYWCVLFHVHFRDGWTWIFRTPIDQTRSVNCTLFETKMWHATLPFLFWIFLFKFNFLINFYQFFEIFIEFFIKFILVNFLSNLFVNYWFWINHRSIAAIICSAHHILNAVTVRNVHHKNIAAATIIHNCKAQLS